MAELRYYLSETIPEAEYVRFCEETEEHALAMLDDRGDLYDDEAASFGAVENDLGSARFLADQFIEAWYGKSSRLSYLERRIGPGNACALALFGTPNVVFWVLLQVSVFLPSYTPMRLPWSPGEIRQFFPEPLPMPELTFRFLLMAGMPLVVPPLMGWIVGRCVPVRPHVAVYRVLTPMILVSYTVGVLLLPVSDGLLFAMVQLVYWLPVGCGCAYLSRARIRRQMEAHVRTWGLA